MNYLLEASVCLIIFYTLYHCLYRAKTAHQLNRFYLLASLFLCLIIPLLHFEVFPVYIKASGIVNRPGAAASIGSEAMSLFDYLVIIYCAGVITGLGLMFYRLFLLYRIIKNAPKKREENHTLVFHNKKIPVSSFFHYLLLPPAYHEELNEFIKAHELVHIRQKHSWDLLFVALVQVVFWFHPVVYLYRRRLVEVHEFLADEIVGAELNQEAYQQFLLQRILQKPASPLAHNFHSLFKKRLFMMNKKKNNSRYLYWVSLPAVSLLIFCFACESYPVSEESDIESQESKPEMVVDTIITFDPETGKESVKVVRSVPKEPTSTSQLVTDTIIYEDPESEKKYVEYFEREGEKGRSMKMPGSPPSPETIDTVVVFDPDTYEEKMYIYDHSTSKKVEIDKE